jgi:hypothetical protein
VCTVSVIPMPRSHGGGFRVACNRDERTTRPAARPPERFTFGERSALMPADPVGGGTWIGVNDSGLTMALLNVNHNRGGGVPTATPPKRSRGLIIPSLLSCSDVPSAVAEFARVVQVAEHESFRLVMIDRNGCIEITSDGRQVDVRRRPFVTPLLFTSSGLGDELVRGPRERLFAEKVVAPLWRADTDISAVQDSYHAHRWPGREHLSVNMRRADARTVSYTVTTL